MPHLDPERLALMALGERISDEDEAAHIEACPRCAAELAELEHTVAIGRATIDDTLETPPPRVWHRITDELGMTTAASAADTMIATPIPLPRRADAREDTDHRRPWLWVLAAAAAVALVVGVGLGVTAWLRPSVVQVASATLDPLPAHAGAQGSAAIDQRPDGTRVLDLTLQSPSTTGYREVWLMTEDATGLISLGLLDGDRGDFVIPQTVDLEQYRLVDVSAEPTDGNPAHSGDSIVRGQLRFG